LRSEPIFLTREQIDTIHHDQIEAWGGLHGIRSEHALESAIAQPLNVYFYGDGDLYEIAAAYAFHIAESQAFFDGNKRTGVGPLSTSSRSMVSTPASYRNWQPTTP